jgi:hypothetical protein
MMTCERKDADMPRIALAALLALTLVPAYAQKKSCDELKAEIEAKLKSKGVKAYNLDIVASADAKDAKVVGSCDGGAKKIVYKRG